MKKTIRLLAVFIIIAMLSISLVSCSKSLTGKYRSNIGGIETTYEFGLFGKVTKTVFIPGVLSDGQTFVTEGTYEILEDTENPNELIIALEFEGEGRETQSFSEGELNGEKFIRIGIIEYKKVK